MASKTVAVDDDVTDKVDDAALPNATVSAYDDTLATGVIKLPIPTHTFASAVTPNDAAIDAVVGGKAYIESKPAKKCDGSNTNKITMPKSDVDIQSMVAAFLGLVQYLKNNKSPCGVLLDSTKISLSTKKDYRLGHEFIKTAKVLESGNSDGEIVVVEDIKTGEEHAHKTMMITSFQTNEIRCWVDSGYAPRLYLFKIEGNRMSVHMEKNLNDVTTDTVVGEKAKTENKAANKLYWDVSNANTIAVHKRGVNMQSRVEACLELVQYIQNNEPPCGVLLDSTKISVSTNKEYRHGHEFTETGKVLGKGNSAGEIKVLKDKKTKEEHANKKMMISCFRTDEIKCWVDLNDTGYVPRLYLVTIDGNEISIHMENLQDAKTLHSIMDNHRCTFGSGSLIRPFSLFVLNGAMVALSAMHKKGWVHNDLHPENAMMQKDSENTLVVKILDFGLATRFNSNDCGIDHKGFRDDISEVLRVFSALYCGDAFNNANDMQTNWEEKISVKEMEVDEKEELMCLVKAGMDLIQPDEVEEFLDLVKVKLNDAMGDQQEEMKQKFVSLLFPEDFQNVHEHSDMDNADMCHDVVDCTGPQQVSRNLPPNRANTTGNRDTEASAKLMK